MKKIDKSRIKKILILRPRAIGDVLLTTPFIRALKKEFKDSEIYYFGEPFAVSVLEGNPYITDIIPFEKNKLKKASLIEKMIYSIKLYGKIASGRYDLVFDLFGNLRTALLSFFSGAKYRVGFTFRGRKYLYNIKVRPDKEPKYNVYYHMDLLKAVGIENDGEELDMPITAEDMEKTDNFMAENGIKKEDLIIALNPAGSWITKRWPEEKFAALGNIIRESLPDAKIVVLWGPGEKEMAEKVINGIHQKSNVFLAPETGLKESGALISRMSAMVTNDGAPKHIAVAVKTPTVTVYGPTNYRSWGPAGNKIHKEVHSGEDCAPCDRTDCPDRDIACMKNISEQDVYDLMVKLLP